MRIAINAADLDHPRIDGTRIYIQNLLKNFGLQDSEDRFLIYHKNKFNSQLKFPVFENYEIIKKTFPLWWTQTRFAWEMFITKPEVLFMPMHSLPFLRSKKTKTVVTIHDLAFKFYPNHFSKKDLRRLNFFTDYAIKNSDKLIAISNSTKNDILKIYPRLRGDKIRVIYHGYDKNIFGAYLSEEKIKKTKAKYQIPFARYIIYVGAIQPRKNIEVLLEAFQLIRRQEACKDLGLVIAGSPGWMAENTLKQIKKTPGALMTGEFETADLSFLLSGAEAFVLPSLYEGFGLPALEAMATGTPVLAADTSSLREVIGNKEMLFNPNSGDKLAQKLIEVFKNEKLRGDMRKYGLERAKSFSWEKCARETLEFLRS